MTMCWLVGFWCTHFGDLAPLIISAPLINSVILLSVMCKSENILWIDNVFLK